MEPFSFYSPTKVIFGRGAENQVGKELLAWGARKVLIHYGGSSALRSGLMDRVEAALQEAELPYVMLGGAQPNPRLGLVREGIELCRAEKVDFILAVGGGSAIDSAKAIALGVPYEGDVWDFYERTAVPSAALPHANIVTLAATGSETSLSSVITKEEGLLKRSSSTPLNRPKFTLMDPELLYTLPPYQTACGIVDIMMHTMERYFPGGSVNEMTDRIAEALLRTVIQYGPVCMREPENYQARSEVMWAGSLSHNTLTGLGRTGDWACHQLEHELGGLYDVAHGAGLSAVWGTWARYVCDAEPMRFARFGVNVWGLSMNYEDPMETARAAICRTEEFFSSLGMPVSLSQLMPGKTVTEEEIEALAEKCSHFRRRTVGNVKKLTKEDMKNIYRLSR